ncbi:MAG: sulfite exporter TauE/SafE family protein [Pseudomonadota bacterium]
MDISALSDGSLLAFVVGLLIAGAVIGFLAGLFGVGGGAISVPILFETFLFFGLTDDVAMPLAVGTSLAMIIPTAIVSTREHSRQGSVDWPLLRAWALPILAGVIVGSILARFAAPAVFQIVFIAVATTTATKLLLGNPKCRLREDLPPEPFRSVYGAMLGLASSLMGVGGGAISNMILTLNGRTIHQAVATSAGVGVLIAIPAALGYMAAGWGKPGLPPDAIGYVSFAALAVTIPTALVTAKFGARAAHALSRALLSRLFGGFLLLVALNFAISLFGG